MRLTDPHLSSRSAVRERIFRRGQLSWADGPATVKCSINNFSPGGARLWISSQSRLPALFYLRDVGSGQLFLSIPVWKNLAEFGVRFLAKDCEYMDDDLATEVLIRAHRHLSQLIRG